MSKTTRVASRSHSHSASRSRSESRSRSRSRSSSRSRSRKHRYGSRSRSRSKSHSPPHNRERKQSREYQNPREFRGYHRGFRRPYYFRGRGRGFFRGRFQRGGGGYNNYRSNNWQNFRQYPQQKQQQQQQQQQQYAHSPKRGRSHSGTPKKHSNSPQPRGHSRRSDRSSSPHSHHSSSSSSSRQRSGSAQNSCKAPKESLSALEETQRSAGNETLSEQGGGRPEAEGSTKGGRAPDILPMNHDSSPKRAIQQGCSADTAAQGDPAASEAHPKSVSSGTTSNGSTCWQPVTSTPSTTCPSKKSPTTVFSGFGLFSDIDQQEDTIAMSMAFKKFLEEQKNKKQANNATHKVADTGNASGEKLSEAILDQPSGLCRPADHGSKRESQKYKHVERAPLLCEDEDEEEDEETEHHLLVQAGENAASKRRSKLPLSARELLEEQVGKLEHVDWDDELEAFLLSRKQERAASFFAALSKREKLSRKLRELSPERPSKVKRKEKSSLSPSPTYAAPPRRCSERREPEMVMIMSDESPPRHSGKKETEFNIRMDSLSDNLARSSVLSNDWRNAMDFVHPDKKEQEFHSMFHHLQCNKLCRSPSELFAQHLVAIVHHIKAQYFPSSGMTLNDRFAMYQRIAAEKELVKARKSPEIHRRIDVSPSAFKRHSLMFDDLKGSVDSSFKVDCKKLKGDTMDLRLDIERRKKYLSRDPNDKQEGEGESGDSPGSDMDLSTEKSSKHLKKSKKSKKNRERSHSSPSTSAPSHEEEVESTEESFSKAQLQLRECSGPTERGQQFRAQARGWNKVNSFGSNSKTYMTVHPKSEDWDQEHIPKSRKYYLQVGKDAEGERKWVSAGGHGQPGVPRVKGRFILRRPTSACTTNSSNSSWSHNKFQASGEDGEHQGNSTEQDHKRQTSA